MKYETLGDFLRMMRGKSVDEIGKALIENLDPADSRELFERYLTGNWEDEDTPVMIALSRLAGSDESIIKKNMRIMPFKKEGKNE